MTLEKSNYINDLVVKDRGINLELFSNKFVVMKSAQIEQNIFILFNILLMIKTFQHLFVYIH